MIERAHDGRGLERTDERKILDASLLFLDIGDAHAIADDDGRRIDFDARWAEADVARDEARAGSFGEGSRDRIERMRRASSMTTHEMHDGAVRIGKLGEDLLLSWAIRDA